MSYQIDSSEIPTGGTTGISHEHTEAISHGARWIVENLDTVGRAIVPELKTRFGLTALEAIQSIRQAQQMRRAGVA